MLFLYHILYFNQLNEITGRIKIEGECFIRLEYNSYVSYFSFVEAAVKLVDEALQMTVL